MNDRKLLSQLDAFVRGGLRPNSLAAFAFAIVCVALATLARWLIDLIAPHSTPYVTYFPVIMIATLVGGWAAGMLALLGSILEVWYLFLPPRHQWFFFTPDRVASLVLFLFGMLIILWISEQFRRVVRQLDEEENYRQVVVDELGHRVKNKLATIYAILRHELRRYPDVWESVSGRLHALSATDDFLVKSKNGSIGLHRILTQELAPYDSSRVSVRGEPVEIQSKLAVVLSLLVHELSTNAANYGALSSPVGRVDVSWHTHGNEIALDWSESGGPPVEAPTKRSFGSNLVERSLDAFGGKANIVFASTGVTCHIRFPKPAEKSGTKAKADVMVA
jgi:two-component sensor histidine kinase